MSPVPRLPLNRSQREIRVFGILTILGFMAYAWILNPSPRALNTWNYEIFNNVTGLPCPFCGGTRATHYLLRGDWAKTLYYNWLAIPSLIGGLALVGVMTFELAKGRVYLPTLTFSPLRLVLGITALLIIWVFHIHDALSSPKPELLNSQGLYFKLKPEDNRRNP